MSPPKFINNSYLVYSSYIDIYCLLRYNIISKVKGGHQDHRNKKHHAKRNRSRGTSKDAQSSVSRRGIRNRSCNLSVDQQSNGLPHLEPNGTRRHRTSYQCAKRRRPIRRHLFPALPHSLHQLRTSRGPNDPDV